ncbi:unnamed protein product [Pleuronectes platessa]|uniref:non-specific serine/threonine protein kinase n=1 Tax=Pleuronectes platessa TaxID=8262 RepID=A0A9N7UXD3_PLEPL|nr:unnamed protein product [Pleuronectes platessa]
MLRNSDKKWVFTKPRYGGAAWPCGEFGARFGRGLDEHQQLDSDSARLTGAKTVGAYDRDPCRWDGVAEAHLAHAVSCARHLQREELKKNRHNCFTNLGLLGRGSFGEVYKVLSREDGRQYAVKRSAHRFRGNSERNLSVREARNHEHLCPHPHILKFVAAWEEYGRLYIQTELCSTSLLLHAENQPPGPDEPAAWAYLCDLLSALQHLHSHGFVHLDLKPSNVLITDSGRLKLGDFGLLLQLRHKSSESVEGKVKDDAQEGDPRYMAPELLRGKYGPAADVFSLGVSILELACNMEVPNGGEGWQQLRQGCLPSEFTSSLSTELQTVLKMMLVPEPSKRPTVDELLALPSVRKHRWKRRFYLVVTETLLNLTSLGQGN